MSDFFSELEAQLRAAAVARRQRRRRWLRAGAVLLGVGVIGAAAPALGGVTGIWKPSGVHERTVAASTVVATSTSRCDDDRPPGLTSSPPDPETMRLFGALRRRATSVDRLPRPARPMLRTLAGVNLEAIRYVGSVAGTRYYALPAGGQRMPCGPDTHRPLLCLLSSHGGGCTPVATIAETGSAGTDGGAARVTIVAGLVPDGVVSVTATLGRSQRTFPVTGNFYGYRVDVSPMDALGPVVWHLADGSTRRVGR
jgi:hypothetical protein